MSLRFIAASLAVLSATVGSPRSPTSIAYTIRLDSAHLDVADVAIELHGAPARFHLAMKVHAEYDAKYWRYLSDLRVESAAAGSTVARSDSTLWDVTLPGGSGVIRYRVHVQPSPDEIRPAWMPTARADGALLNPPDFFLYLPEAASAPVTVQLDVPHSWRIATALPTAGEPTRRSARDATTLLDSPILLGALREWRFDDHGTAFHLVYWRLPDAAPFDSVALVDAVRRMAHAATDLFGRGPAPEYWFLLQDGADDALEHASSVTLGARSATLAEGMQTLLPTFAHEFFHAWNLVAIRPAGYNDLSYRAPARTPSLWVGEGITLYYGDALLRRAGLTDTTRTRLDYFAVLASRYFGSPATRGTSPERASLAFPDSPIANPEATGGYYLQGELLGNVIDALVRDSTHDARGLDDVMRRLFEASRREGYRGFTAADVQRAVDSTCRCQAGALFARQVRATGPIDVASVASRLGYDTRIDTIVSADDAGNPVPDLRLGSEFPEGGGNGELIVSNPGSMWAKAGLKTGDVVTSFNGTAPRSFGEMQRAMRALRIGYDVSIDVVRSREPIHVRLVVAGFSRTRVRFVERPNASPVQLQRRARWLAGR